MSNRTEIATIPATIRFERVVGEKDGKAYDFVAITIDSLDGEIRLKPDPRDIGTGIAKALAKKGVL